MIISNGKVSCLGDHDIMEKLGHIKRRRISNIIPHNAPVKLIWFKLLRKWFGDRGRVARWTRRWKCVWAVEWADDPGVTVFYDKSRAKCVAWELMNLDAATVLSQ